MEESAELLERVRRAEPIVAQNRSETTGEWPVRFSHVIESAQAFLAAVLANAYHSRQVDKRHAADSTIWVLCPSVHSQELFYESLLNWQPDALFLPEAELAGIENILPDPEIAAERLALFTQIEREPARASSSQRAPVSIKPRRNAVALESAVVQLRRGADRRDGRASRSTRGERLRTRRTSHNSRTVCRPRRNCRSLFVAGAIAVPCGIFRRRNRVAARIRYRYANVACAICSRSIFCSIAAADQSVAEFAIMFAKRSDHRRRSAMSNLERKRSKRDTSKSAKAGLRQVRKILAARFRIARSESLAPAISCWPRPSARSLSSA